MIRSLQIRLVTLVDRKKKKSLKDYRRRQKKFKSKLKLFVSTCCMFTEEILILRQQNRKKTNQTKRISKIKQTDSKIVLTYPPLNWLVVLLLWFNSQNIH